MAEFKALIFDVDGVVAETEADGHRVAFNRVFEEEGLPIRWDKERYGELLKIAGGKERLRTEVYSPDFPKQVEDKEEYIKKLHKRKTDIYMEMIASGVLKPREGVGRLIREAHDAGLKLAVASTSNERGVRFLLQNLLGDEIYNLFDVILAGDVVKNKKPDPEIYFLAAEKLGVKPEECAVVEDTMNGLRAAKGAGMKCVVTRSEYTKNEPFEEADLVVDSLGEPPGPHVSIEDIRALFQ